MKKLVYVLLLLSLEVSAQNNFTLEAFLSTVLEKDFSIRIARNNLQQATNNNNPGAAGYLPEISVGAEQNWTINSARQEFLSGQVNEATNAQNRSLNAGLMLNWTFFDGFNMFLEDKRLSLLQESARINMVAEMELKIYSAAMAFYTFLLLDEMNNMYAESIKLSQMRLEQIEVKRNLGASNDLEWIQVKLDVAADSAVLIQNQRAMAVLQAQLNAFIAREPELPFISEGRFPLEFANISWDDIKRKGLQQNSSILQAKTLLAIREKEHKQVLSRYYPQLAFYSGYNFGTSQNQVGFLLSNRSYGPQFGLTLRWDILSGLSRMYNERNAKLEIDNAELWQLERENAILAELRSAYLDYEWAQKNMALETKNIELLERGSVVMQKSLELGSITPLQLREFQFSIVQAQTRYIEAKMLYMTAKLNLFLGTSDFSTLLSVN
jgi:outer membrane protein TolC